MTLRERRLTSLEGMRIYEKMETLFLQVCRLSAVTRYNSNVYSCERTLVAARAVDSFALYER